jgi:hypothetical protein|nr:MAG TPA: protein of unknown function DUF3799 [Bacteriophage sp.]
MTKITNKLNLPKQLVDLISSDYQPKKHQYSCTTILKSTRQVILERRHNNEIEQDVSEMVWCIFGILAHSVIENSQEDVGQFKEEKLKVDLGKYCKELEGYYLSGRSDMIDLLDKCITDWKTASCWKVIYKDFEDWRKEMLIYAWAVKDMGFEIDKAQAIAFLKDHNKTKAKVDSSYPQLPVWVEKFKFTDKDFEDIEEFIKNRFLELKKYEDVPDEDLPMCSMEERWNEGDKYIVIKKGNKRATKIHKTLEEAEKHLDNLEKNYPNMYEIQKRLGEDKRCLEYCSACEFCPYYQEKYMKGDE